MESTTKCEGCDYQEDYAYGRNVTYVDGDTFDEYYLEDATYIRLQLAQAITNKRLLLSGMGHA